MVVTSKTKLLVVSPSFQRALDFMRASGISEREVSVVLEPEQAYGLRGGYFVDLWFPGAGRFEVRDRIRQVLLQYAEFDTLFENSFVAAVEQKRSLQRAMTA